MSPWVHVSMCISTCSGFTAACKVCLLHSPVYGVFYMLHWGDVSCRPVVFFFRKKGNSLRQIWNEHPVMSAGSHLISEQEDPTSIFLGGQVMVAAALAGCSRPLSHQLYFVVPPGKSQGCYQTSRNMLFLLRVLALLPDGRAGITSKGSRSEGILIRCPDLFSWFLPKEVQLCSELPLNVWAPAPCLKGSAQTPSRGTSISATWSFESLLRAQRVGI